MSTDESFAPLDQQPASRCGPPAVLLTGHAEPEAELLHKLLEALELSGVPVGCCTLPMLGRPLLQALEQVSAGTRPAGEDPIPPDQLPRALILSGLTGAEVHRLLDAFRAARIPRPIVATTTPKNLRLTVRELLRHLLAEHAAMQQRRSQSAPDPSQG